MSWWKPEPSTGRLKMSATHKRARNRLNAKGRNKYERHIQLTYRLLESGAYRSLTLAARCLLTELSMLYNGDNNGSLYLSVRDAAARLGLGSLEAVQNAFDELQQAGFIRLVRDAHFSVKAGEHSRARTWRLNWMQGPGKQMPDLKLYEWEPGPKTKGRVRMERGLKALKTYRRRNTHDHFPVSECNTSRIQSDQTTTKPVSDSVTASTENRASPANDVVTDSRTHIDHQGCQSYASATNVLAWWKPAYQPNLLAKLVYSAILAKQLERSLAETRHAA